MSFKETVTGSLVAVAGIVAVRTINKLLRRKLITTLEMTKSDGEVITVDLNPDDPESIRQFLKRVDVSQATTNARHNGDSEFQQPSNNR